MTDRDHFAAAALTGWLASQQTVISQAEMAQRAYRYADAMLRERGQENHDAAPACADLGNQPEKPDSSREDSPGEGWRWVEADEALMAGDEYIGSDGGWRKSQLLGRPCEDEHAYRRRIDAKSNHDAAPAARVQSGSTRADNAGTLPRLDTGDTQEPVDDSDWLRHAVARDAIKVAKLEAEIKRLREAIRRLAKQDATLSVCDGNVTVTLDATLTDEERHAIAVVRSCAMTRAERFLTQSDAEREATLVLWRLRERLG
jgi:hypothetical protein